MVVKCRTGVFYDYAGLTKKLDEPITIIHVNGAALYCEEHGTGSETIVFAQGLLWSCRMFDAQVAQLKERHRCVVFDFRGQGQSEVTRSGYDMETLYEDAVALIEQRGCAGVADSCSSWRLLPDHSSAWR
jgi:pimeloyl-ACP methyl ester carboxylesterase